MKFDRDNIGPIHDRLTLALKEFCRVEGLQYNGSNLKYNETGFDVKVSVKQPGGQSLAEHRDALGCFSDKNGKWCKAGDTVRLVSPNDLARGATYTVIGARRVKAIVQTFGMPTKYLIPFDQLEKVS